MGGGYRTILNKNMLIGVNGFYDASQLSGRWQSSGGVGLEFAALLSGSDAFDLNFNWYGSLFNGTAISNVFRYGPSNFDVEVGYSHELWDHGPDFRLKFAGYHFEEGGSVYGWNAGGELKTRDGMISVRYEVGDDRVNSTYHTVAAFVNMGFDVNALGRGSSPFMMPEPIFRSPRNLTRLLTEKVKRNWNQSTVPGGRNPAFAALVREFASIAMSWDGWRWCSGGCVAFDSPVPYTALQPGRQIVVTLDFSFANGAPSMLQWIAEVWGPVCWSGPTNYGDVFMTPAASGSATIVLHFGGDQDAFIAAATDVHSLIIQCDNADSANPVTVTNVRVRFNQ